jgi:hypothetical protein
MKTIFPSEMLNSSQEAMSIESVATKMLYFIEQVHLIHWQAMTHHEHIITGTFYEFLEDVRDGLIEKLMGYQGRRIGMYKVEQFTPCTAEMVVNEVMSFADSLKRYADNNGYHDVAATADTISGECAKTLYLLSFKHGGAKKGLS